MAALVISYSRQDRHLIRAVASLLRSAINGIDKAVFWDDAFETGIPWFEQFAFAVDESPQLFVFWCVHSSRSPEVLREYEYAVERHKRVIPVLLDDTPLPETLAPIHGIDLRDAVRHEGPRPPGSRGGMPEPTDEERIAQSRAPDPLHPYSYLSLRVRHPDCSELAALYGQAHSDLAAQFTPFF